MFLTFKQSSNSLILAIILLSTLRLCSTLAKNASEPIITQYITTCEPNQPKSAIFSFNFSYNSIEPKIDGPNKNDLELVNGSKQTGYEKDIRLKNSISDDSFTFNLIFDTTIIRINGIFSKECENSYTSSCTVIIAFLASLCLILFTALALALIILRRKKPITFKFGQQSDRDNGERSQYNTNNDYNEYNFDESRKESTFDASNGVMGSPKTLSPFNETIPTYPRKSSLKPPKNGSTEQISNINNNNNNDLKANSMHDNAAYVGSELEKVDEESEEKCEDEPKKVQEIRRKSIVTFSEKTDIKYTSS